MAKPLTLVASPKRAGANPVSYGVGGRGQAGGGGATVPGQMRTSRHYGMVNHGNSGEDAAAATSKNLSLSLLPLVPVLELFHSIPLSASSSIPVIATLHLSPPSPSTVHPPQDS